MMLIWFALGLIWGWLSIAFQVWTVKRLDARSAPLTVIWFVGGFVVRLGWIALLLIFALRQGIGLGLSTFAGIWLARWVMIVRLHKLATFNL